MSDVSDLEKQAVPYVDRFHSYMMHDSSDAVVTLMSDKCLATDPPDTIKATFQNIHRQCGNVIQTTLLENKVSYENNGGKKLNLFIQTYKTSYASGKVMREHFIFFIENNRIGKIDTYNFEPYTAEEED